MATTLTTRSQDALSTATRHAATAGNARLEPVHLLHALLTQEQGVPAALLEAVGSDPALVTKGTQALMDALPSAQGDSVSSPTTSRGVLEVLQRASDLAGELGATHVVNASDVDPVAAIQALGGADVVARGEQVT